MHLALAEAQGAQAAPHLAVGSLLLSGVLPLLAVVVVAADIACLTINQSITFSILRARTTTNLARAREYQPQLPLALARAPRRRCAVSSGSEMRARVACLVRLRRCWLDRQGDR